MLQYFIWLKNKSSEKGPFQCPCCHRWNTEQGTYYDLCNDCGYYQGY